MNFDEFSTAPCVIPPSTVAGGCAGTDPRCLDLEWAANNLDVCPGSPSIVALRVTPATATVEVGASVPYAAALVFSDGRLKDVTSASAWSISDGAIASIDTHGLAKGIAIGTTTIQATYGNLIDFAQITVVADCVQAGMDIVLVFDRSAGHGALEDNGTILRESLLELAKEASRALVESAILTSGKDRIAVVSCAGLHQENVTPAYQSQATLHMTLSSVKEDIVAAVDSIAMGNCYYDIADGQHGSECATGIGAGLQKAKAELDANGRAGARKLIVYIGNGYEVYCDPDPIAVASDIADANYLLAAVALGAAITHYPCSQSVALGQMTTWAYLQLLVTCELFWGVSDLDTLPAVFADVLLTICQEQNGGCIYYVPSTDDPPPVVRYRDQLDYNALINWEVIDGFVDLIGIDLWPLQPGYGLFLDMVGTDLETIGKHKKCVGTIRSKTAFNLAPGRYRLKFEVAGNLRFDVAQMGLRVTVDGGLLDKIITVTDWQQPFTLYTYDFSVTTATAAKITFAHQPLPPHAVLTVGLLLDNIHLENLDTGAVLLDDNFNSENPIEE